MFPFKRKRPKSEFKIDIPNISIAPDMPTVTASLKSSDTPYEVVTDGYIVFQGKAFDCDIPLMFGIHYNQTKVEFIEIFRPLEYTRSKEYNVNISFKELSEILKSKYGRPTVTTTDSSPYKFPREEWRTPNFSIEHYIFDRFGPEEHLHICFYR